MQTLSRVDLVLWNNEMTICIGLKTEMTGADFMEEVITSHTELTGMPVKAKEGILKEVDGLIWKFEFLEEPRCRVCGCTWNNACDGGCYWVEKDLCSKCVGKQSIAV